MKKNKASSVVISGHPAGLMLSVIRSVERYYIMIGMISFNKYLVVIFREKD
jgi:hypothetical protein